MEKQKEQENENVKMNLTLNKGFYLLLQQESNKDYMKTATWVKQFLMKHLLGKHKEEEKGGPENEHSNKN